MIIRNVAILIVLMLSIPIFVKADKQPAHLSAQQTAIELLKMLKDRQFDVLDRKLNDFQLEYERDTEKETILSETFSAIATIDPDMEDVFMAWLSSYPSSYAANLANGMYYMDMAIAWRGGKFIKDTPEWKLDKMDQYIEKAIAKLKQSLTMTKKPTLSYTLLIRAARLNGSINTASDWLKEAIKRDPYCVLPRNAYMSHLEPRWGGSYTAMQQFASKMSEEHNPKLKKAARKYQGWVHWYQGEEKSWKKDYVAALKHYNAALAKEEDAKFLIDRAWLYKRVGQIDLALYDVNRVLELSYNYGSALYLKGLLLLEKLQIDEGMKELHIAAERGNMDAMNELGYIYTSGQYGVSLNIDEGIRWFKKVVYFGDEYAASSLGTIYARGLGVPVDLSSAAKYYEIAASMGDGKAINELGLIYWYGRGVPVNHNKAIEFWVKGTEKGIWQSKHNLKFFLSKYERMRLVIKYPSLLLIDKSLLWYPLIAAIVLLLIVISIIVFMLVRVLACKRK